MATGRVCPKCHYQRKPADDDFYPEYECPKCGIVYDKLIPPERATTTDNHKTGSAGNPDLKTASHPNTFSISRKQIYSVVLLLIAVFVVYTVFIKIFSSATDLSGTYTGEAFIHNKNISVEFNIDKQHRITRILKKQTKEIRSGDGISKIEETFLWQYPNVAKITYSKLYNNSRFHVNEQGQYTYSLEKKGKTIEIKMDAPNGFSINSSVNIHDSKRETYNSKFKKFSTDQSIFFISFNHNIIKAHMVKIGRMDVNLPEQLSFKGMRRYCPQADNDISRITSEISAIERSGSPQIYQYSLSPAANQCTFSMGDSFRLKFKILFGDIHSYIQGVTKNFNTDTNEPMLILEITPIIFARISLNSKGYGQFENIPIRKVGIDASKKEINNSAEEWKTIFIKRDQRYKNRTFEAIKKRQQEAFELMEEKIKRAGPE